MFRINADFIGNFKIGDNIGHNFRMLIFLYRQYDKGTIYEKRMLCKPIIISLAAIIEAILYDFHQIIKHNHWEGVAALSGNVINAIRSAKLDDFGKYINSAKRHNLFDEPDIIFYEKLNKLRKMRNRTHIQNEWKTKPADEYAAFNEEEKILAENTLEKILRVMNEKYRRPEHARGWVKDFIIPWNPHFPTEADNQKLKFCPSCGFPEKIIDDTTTTYICDNCGDWF